MKLLNGWALFYAFETLMLLFDRNLKCEILIMASMLHTIYSLLFALVINTPFFFEQQ